MKQIEQLKIRPLQIIRQTAGTQKEETTSFGGAQKPCVGLVHFPQGNGTATAKEVRATTHKLTQSTVTRKAKAVPPWIFLQKGV